MSRGLSYLLAIVAVMIVCAAVAIAQRSEAVLIVGLGGTIIVGLFNGLKQAEQAFDTATALKQSGNIQAHQLEEIKTVTDATHTLVNSNYGGSLKATLLAHQSNVASLKAVRSLTTRKEDIEIADAAVTAAEAAVVEAQRLYDDHQAKQAIVDSGSGIAITEESTS